jgi:ABC-2 type transport system ATP-binding protein
MTAVSQDSNAPEIVVIEDVSKRFVIRKDNSLKERLVTLGRGGRRHKEEFWALSGVTATIRAGETVALIGHNGSGKSTLLKVIGGIIDPTNGVLARRGRIAALLELGAGFHPDLTGRENVYLNASIMGMSRIETESKFDEILAFSGISDFIDTQVKFYSSGMYVRLAFAVAVHTEPDLLLVDEVLAVGDEAFQRKCLDKIRDFQKEGRTIVLVTHSLSQVTELCSRAILLNKGHVVVDGDPRDAVARFRDILEDRRVADLPGTAEEARAQEGRITAPSAAPRGREVGSDLNQGDDLVIEMDVEHPQGIDEWVCAIQIDNTLGQVVYGTTTRRLGTEPERLAERRRVSFILRDTHFGTGKYFVNLSIMEPSGRHLVDVPQACSFNVADTPLAAGTTYATPEFFDEQPTS